jgi:hypothetical protein
LFPPPDPAPRCAHALVESRANAATAAKIIGLRKVIISNLLCSPDSNPAIGVKLGRQKSKVTFEGLWGLIL